MDQSSCCRPQRQRRHSRRAWPPEDDDVQQQLHLTKRLFTQDIKGMLKDWLIRRRDNPYPSRDEKKRLALATGLTYTQICNWFANWRRKLKNSERERGRRSWGYLIKNYNNNARGNVEQFSISSDNSIWEEQVDRHYNGADNDEDEAEDDGETESQENESGNGFYQLLQPYEACCNQMVAAADSGGAFTHCGSKTKYKQKIMEKYMREEQAGTHHQTEAIAVAAGTADELSKWIESAARFTPNKNNYYIEWNNKRHKLEKLQAAKMHTQHVSAEQSMMHHKDEMDAALVLANLAFNCRKRLLDAHSSDAIAEL